MILFLGMICFWHKNEEHFDENLWFQLFIYWSNQNKHRIVWIGLIISLFNVQDSETVVLELILILIVFCSPLSIRITINSNVDELRSF